MNVVVRVFDGVDVFVDDVYFDAVARYVYGRVRRLLVGYGVVVV